MKKELGVLSGMPESFESAAVDFSVNGGIAMLKCEIIEKELLRMATHDGDVNILTDSMVAVESGERMYCFSSSLHVLFKDGENEMRNLYAKTQRKIEIKENNNHRSSYSLSFSFPFEQNGGVKIAKKGEGHLNPYVLSVSL